MEWDGCAIELKGSIQHVRSSHHRHGGMAVVVFVADLGRRSFKFRILKTGAPAKQSETIPAFGPVTKNENLVEVERAQEQRGASHKHDGKVDSS
jgi:hypothetical protein